MIIANKEKIWPTNGEVYFLFPDALKKLLINNKYLEAIPPAVIRKEDLLREGILDKGFIKDINANSLVTFKENKGIVHLKHVFLEGLTPNMLAEIINDILNELQPITIQEHLSQIDSKIRLQNNITIRPANSDGYSPHNPQTGDIR